MNAFVRRLLGWTLLAPLAASLALAQTMPASRAYYFGTWVGASSLGTADGAGSAARFSYPFGLTTDAAGNLFVADTFNHTIRKITPAGVVTTLAGSPGESGSVDASGSAARFNQPQAIASHSDGNLYVGEAGGIRRVSRDGAATLLVDKARFDGNIVSLLSEPDGTLLVADRLTVARISTSGEIATNELGSVTSATATLTVTPPAGSADAGGGSGGGGAPSDFFFIACAVLAFARALRRSGGKGR